MEKPERNTNKKQEGYERDHFASLQELEFKCYTLNSAACSSGVENLVSNQQLLPCRHMLQNLHTHSQRTISKACSFYGVQGRLYTLPTLNGR
jgi:hypothetical protein